jgi:hypothetical protein
MEYLIVYNVSLNTRRWFVLCLIYIHNRVLVLVSGDEEKDKLYGADPTKYVLPEDGDIIQSPKIVF